MADVGISSQLAREVKDFVLRDFHPPWEGQRPEFSSNPLWLRLRELGTELWLDTGDLDEASGLWTQEFTALTTNNTLLNKEVQTGQYDALIREAGELLRSHGLTDEQMRLELAFILNARHALTLVEHFNAYVSVEEHTDLAMNVQAAVDYARRYREICPQRFIVKIPFTPAGLLATRVAVAEGIPVNHTLGFSARQNYAIARVAAPKFVNVFLGRLNSFISENGLGDGQYVGERATLASQEAIRLLRTQRNIDSRQIGASFRSGAQVRDLAGIDVMTMPPKVARQFLDLSIPPQQLENRSDSMYQPSIDKIDPAQLNIDTLWEVNQELADCLDQLEHEDLSSFTPQDLVDFFAARRCGDFLVEWTEDQMRTSYQEGKIPAAANWADLLGRKQIGLDALMNLAGLNSFIRDQEAMDDRVRDVLGGWTGSVAPEPI